ncbi:MAG TPA: NAD-binding protein [Stellaceae bacterium]|nr:NAD-binding protein [Stellaceae bacterium]
MATQAERPPPPRQTIETVLKGTSFLKLRDWFVLAPVALVGMGLALWGFSHCPVNNGRCTSHGFWEVLTRSFNLVRGAGSGFTFGEDPWELVVAQFALPAVAIVGAAKLVLANLRRDMRVVMAKRQRNHAIVCGLGETGRHVVENLRAAGSDVVGVTLDTDDPNSLACERLRVPVLKGDATNAAILDFAGLPHARALILTCGSDALNIEVSLRMIERFRGGRSSNLYVMPEIRSHWLLELMQTHRSATLGCEGVEIRPFDLYANAARFLLRSPAFAHGPAAAAPRPHLLIAGLGELGTQIVLQAVQTTFAVPGRRLAATVFDQQGEDSLAGLAARFGGISAVADLEFVATNFDSADPASWTPVWSKVEQTLRSRDPGVATVAVVVALKDDRDALHTALQFRDRLDRLGELRTPVFVRLREGRKLGEFAAGLDGADALVERVTPFGDLRYLTTPRLLLDQVQDTLARAVHACYLEGARRGDEQPDSPSLRPWPQLPERFKQSNRRAADHIPVKLRQIGMRIVRGEAPPISFSAAEVETLARAEHWRWSIERRSLGWVRGDARNDVTHEHPDLVDWDVLPPRVQEQNRALVRDIPRMVAAAGLDVRRERVVLALPHTLAEAQLSLGALDASDQPVVVFDPDHTDCCEVARQAVVERGAILRVLWGEPHRIPMLPPIVSDRARIKAAIETSLFPEEIDPAPRSCQSEAEPMAGKIDAERVGGA